MTAASSAVERLRRSISADTSVDERRAAVRCLLAAPEDRSGEDESAPADCVADDSYEAAIDAASLGVEARVERRSRVSAQAEDLADRLLQLQRSPWNEALRLPSAMPPELFGMTVEALVRRVDRLALDASPRAIELAQFVCLWVESARATLPTELAAELSARACAALSESHFRAGNLVEAERALVAARNAYAESNFSPLLGGDLARIEGGIRCDQSRFTEARKLLERAVRLFRRAGDHTAEARATISLALKWYYEGDVERALAVTDQAVAMLDPERDQRLLFAAEFNRVYWSNDAGMTDRARAALPALAALAERAGADSDRFRIAWLEARIVAREGDLASAVRRYEPLLARAIELELPHDSATIGFELAILLLELGRAAEVLPLAETVARIFASQGDAPEAGAALLVAADALRQGAAAAEALRMLRDRDPRQGRKAAG